jgi:hypothetical protein
MAEIDSLKASNSVETPLDTADNTSWEHDDDDDDVAVVVAVA